MYQQTMISLIASFIEQNIISRDYYNECIAILVEAVFKTHDIEDTCHQVWNYVVKEEYEVELALLMALAEAPGHDSLNPNGYESLNNFL